MKKNHLIVFFIFLIFFSFSQRGKHGAFTASALNTKVNEYTTLTSDAFVGNTTINVANSNLNTNSRFASNLQIGDLIMIIQMQGTTMKTFTTVPGQDSTYGAILSYNNCGNYELAQVYSIPNLTSIVLDCGLKYNYTASGKTQIVRLPRYASLTVNVASSITGDTWNGSIGGIVAAEVLGNTTVNGSITATGLGFRGGLAANDGTFGGTRYVDLGGGIGEGGEKGESVVGSQLDYIALYGGKYAKGAPANGGGGGDSHNCAGGGGANAGSLNNWTGYGVTNAAYATAFNLEFAGRAAIVSAGGGRGGYGFSANNINPNTNAPNTAAWGGANRPKQGGHGGRCVDYSTGKIFLGGGGGAGHVNNIGGTNTGGTGGNGGGIIFMQTFGSVGGAGNFISNGANGVTATGVAPGGLSNSVVGDDPGGGAGGGGTILISTAASVAGVNLIANGGLGGDVIILKGGFAGTVNQGFGPGGGGGGGYIALTAGAPTQQTNGGVSGNMIGPNGSASIISNFPVNGATNGNVGLNNQSIPLYSLTANPVTVCVNSSATLTATSNNVSASFIWYNAITGATQIAVGSVFTSSVFTSVGTYTIFAGMCPGNYRIPVTITVINGPTLTVSNPTICNGQTATVTATGATNYTWSTGATISSITPSPIASAVYTVIGANGSCSTAITASVTVISTPTIGVNSATICNGQTATLTAGAASGYTWSNSTNLQSVSLSPAITTTYNIIANVGVGCNASNTATITVNPNPTLTANSVSICSGQTASLVASGANSYVWDNGITSATNNVSPLSSISYTVTGSIGTCSSSAISNVTVNAIPVLTISSVSICTGQTATLTAAGASSYTWDPIGLNVISSTFTTSPVSTTSYSVFGSTNGCIGSNTVNVTVGTNLSVSVNNSTICSGQSATLVSVSTATNFVWSNSGTTSSIVVSPVVTSAYTINANYAGCTGSSTAMVYVNALPSVSISGNGICTGQTATLSASGASSYTWSTLNTSNIITTSPSISTTYSVVGALGICTNSALYNVTVTPTPTVLVNSISVCNGVSATLIASGATNYNWLPSGVTVNSLVINPTSNTTYTVVGSIGSCTNSALANVSVTTGGALALSNTIICFGQTTTIGPATSGLSYLWNTGATTQSISVTPTTTSSYSLQFTDVTGCVLTGTCMVNVSPASLLQANGTSICLGKTALLSVTGASNYTWMPGNLNGNSITVSPTISSIYTVSSSNANGCLSTATVLVLVSTSPNLIITSNQNMVCPNTPITFSASGAINYQWIYNSNYYYGSNIQIHPSKSGTISVVANNNGCYTSSVIAVNVSSLSSSFQLENSYVDYPGSLSFTNTSTHYTSVYWEFGNGQTSTNTITTAMYENPGKYLVALLAKDEYGCTDTTYYVIEAGCGKGDFYIPNTFTPNGDGLNDEFKVFGGTCLIKFECTIFDRWGTIISKLKNNLDVWDGTYKGEKVEIGTYNYLINYTLYNGKQFSKTGVINIVK
jgi:gliding motility-associated-like protein